MKRTRSGSQQGIQRPFAPSPAAENSEEQMSDALDSIARSLAAIDHNLEALTVTINELAQVLPDLLKK